MALIPALFVVISLPNGRGPAADTGALHVAPVTLGRDIDCREQAFNQGREVSARQRAARRFGCDDADAAEAARKQARDGWLASVIGHWRVVGHSSIQPSVDC